MLIYFVTFISFVVFYKYSLPIKQLPSWQVFKKFLKSFSALNKDTNTTDNVKTNDPSLLDLPDLALESILQKLDPIDLCRTACVSTYLRDICSTDYLWKHHMNQKWDRVIRSAAEKQLQSYILSQKNFDSEEKRRFFKSFLSKLWHFTTFKSSRTNDERKRFQLVDGCATVSCFRALETGKFWFPAQVFNRENGHVGFVMSCYDAELRYDRISDSFEARYPPHGPREVAAEYGVTWDRLREARVDDSPHDLHISNCLNDLRPKDHVEIQWRRNKQFPYGWWYGVIGHLEFCDGNDTYCRCHESDSVVLEFKQYAVGSRWRHMTINRHDHHEEGNEAEGFYGGIKKLYNKDEISMWQHFWPTDILE